MPPTYSEIPRRPVDGLVDPVESRAGSAAGHARDTGVRYRPDVDGLRAIAVLFVIGFHMFPRWVPGGFVGVDVFFVISGFLISSIIFAALDRGQFSYAGFYARRIKRIFPALAVVLIACVPLGWLILFRDEYRALGTEIAAGAGFVANLEFWRESGYFDADAGVKPLLHLWSLGVEEQFYFTWPLILVAVARRPGRAVAIAFGVLMAASFFVNVAFVSSHPEATFYSPVARFWELVIGCTLALAAQDERGVIGWAISSFARRAESHNTTRAIRALCGWVGLALLVIAAGWLNKTAPFPGWWALLPTVGTALIIAAGPHTWPNRRIFSTRALVAIGLVSYPLYLWHWPLLVFARINAGGELTRTERLEIIALSGVLAAATYAIVEKPIRFGRSSPAKPVALASLMAVLVAAGIYVAQSATTRAAESGQSAYVQYFENSAPQYRYSNAHNVFANFRAECDFYDALGKKPRESISPSCVTASTSETLLIWGDSHAAQFNVGLRDVLPSDVSILQVATSACSPSLDDRSPDTFQSCNRSNRFALQTIQRTKPTVVLLAQRSDHESTDWPRIAAAAKAAGAQHVVVVGPVPQWTSDLHKLIARKYWDHTPLHIPDLSEAIMETDATMRRLYSSTNDLQYISLIERLCDSSGCLAYLNGDRMNGLMAQDYGHLTRAGSTYVAKRIIAPAVLPLLTGR